MDDANPERQGQEAHAEPDGGDGGSDQIEEGPEPGKDPPPESSPGEAGIPNPKH